DAVPGQGKPWGGLSAVCGPLSSPSPDEQSMPAYFEIPHGLSFGRKRSSRPAAGPLRLLTVSPLDWQHGLEFSLLAVAALRKLGVECECRVVGEGSLWEHVHFFAHLLGIDGSTQFRGDLNADGLADEFARADVLLHLPVVPSASRAVLQAQASGLPVVCSVPGNAAGIVEP